MPCTAIKSLASAVLLATSVGAIAAESNKVPRYLTVPALGLRVDVAGLKLDRFPEDLRATCDQIADDDYHTGQVWIFGRAKDAAATYYILSGYFKRRTPSPEKRLYQTMDDGGVFVVRGNQCGGDDASETFNARDPNADNDGNVPISILRELARDLAAQTVRAFGSAEQLRSEIKKQRIDFHQLSPELQETFAPYFGK